MKFKVDANLTGTRASVKISDLNHDGEGVGRLEELVVFVPGALPGEEVEIEIAEQHKSYIRAKMLTISTVSPARIAPPCPYFAICGSCQLQHLDYPAQLSWKTARVKEALLRIGNLELPVLPAIGMVNPYRYRNKGRFHLAAGKDQLMAGFFASKSHDLINIEDCLIQHTLNIEALNTLRMVNPVSGSRERPVFDLLSLCYDVELRTSFTAGQVAVTLGCRQDHPDLTAFKQMAGKLEKALGPKLAGLIIKTPGKHRPRYREVSGTKWVEEKINFYNYRISPQSFFQVNPLQAGELFRLTAEFAGNPQTAIDLYCGTGNFSLHLSRVARQVIGIDSEESAVADARYNASLNGVKNVRFISGRAEENSALLTQGADPKTIILDPPRKGCSPQLLQAVADAKPEWIVYTSCNPSTLARDLKLLHSKGYLPRKVQPVDMFPQTSHVETVVLITSVRGTGV